ncbi:MAG TPA: DUF1598 domain-containing protein [Planctomycetaceae bacterium]|jgi:hypothetical protein|nr:DUF1598 domain-containing protein [Planctomycetaceae bacterium]
MSRRSPKSSLNRRTSRRSSKVGPIVASVLSAAAIFGLIGYLAMRPVQSVQSATSAAPIQVASTNGHPEASPSAAPHVAAPTAKSPATHSAPHPSNDVRILTAAKPASTEPATTAADRLKRVEAQLAAGEFGPALETAKSADDAAERSGLLKTIAAAQAKSGDFVAADRVISRIPIPESRERAGADNAAARQSAAGGAASAAQLVSLIKTVTGTEQDWEDTDEAKKTPIYWPPGIEVDPNGLLRGLTHEEKGQTLSGLGHRAREADINTDMRAKSSLRLVSLTRLEKELAKKLSEGRSVPETMQHLAGLSQVRYVFVYPEQQEVVIGGPAEGWKYDASGRAVARESGRPSLFLDDLVTVLRTFSPRGAGYFNCQILPREEGLRRIQQFVQESSARGPIDSAQLSTWTKRLQQELGLQDVEINGVPVESRIAQVIFEADYRLKMIGIGKLHAGHGIASYFDILPKTGEVKSQKMDALRWWLSMKYDSVTHSPDRNVFQIEGSAVLCQSENEKISAKGQRIHTGQSEAANHMFAESFTDHYSELATGDPVFADLQNVFDLSLVAALLSDNRVPDRLGWDLGVFAAGGAYQPATFQPAKTIQSVVNHRVYNGKDIVVQVAGGVDGRMRNVLEDRKVFREASALTAQKSKGRAPQLPEGRWWWDAKSN